MNNDNRKLTQTILTSKSFNISPAAKRSQKNQSLKSTDPTRPLHSHSQFENAQKLILPKTALKPVEPVGHDQDRLCSDPDGVGSERRVARIKILIDTREAE